MMMHLKEEDECCCLVETGFNEREIGVDHGVRNLSALSAAGGAFFFFFFFFYTTHAVENP
jgi:hypothetical protein